MKITAKAIARRIVPEKRNVLVSCFEAAPFILAAAIFAVLKFWHTQAGCDDLSFLLTPTSKFRDA